MNTEIFFESLKDSINVEESESASKEHSDSTIGFRWLKRLLRRTRSSSCRAEGY